MAFLIMALTALSSRCFVNLSFCAFDETVHTVTLSPVTLTYVCNRLKTEREKSCQRWHLF